MWLVPGADSLIETWRFPFISHFLAGSLSPGISYLVHYLVQSWVGNSIQSVILLTPPVHPSLVCEPILFWLGVIHIFINEAPHPPPV